MAAAAFSTAFAEGLSQKFADEGEFASKYFTVRSGRFFDRIFAGPAADRMTHIHAFVERETGQVFKAAGLSRPAPRARYATVEAAIEAADLYGSYLYLRG